MRLTRVMLFVTALLLLATMPVVLQFARMNGMHPSSALATAGAVCFMAVLAGRRAQP